MASRFSAARPKRDGENFVRTHHHDREEEGDPKRIKFDVRNPSKLAADAREEDAILDADVIKSSNTKRGAVNLDGYDSDSDAEDFKASSGRGENVSILDKLDNYNQSLQQGTKKGGGQEDGDDDDEVDDMFAADGDADADAGDGKAPDQSGGGRSDKKDKSVRFMDATTVGGEEKMLERGGQESVLEKRSIRMDDEPESSEDDEEANLRLQEEAVDEEVGAGGLKRNAPKVEAFNLVGEMEEGRFDEAGNFIRKAGDPDAEHDNWLEGVSKKEMKKAAEAHEKRESEARLRRMAEDQVLVSDLLGALISRLERAETPMEALARLGKLQPKPKKQAAKWKLKKNRGEGMDMDSREAQEEPERWKIKQSIEAITDAADKLLGRDFEDIYEQERELLIREYRREAGEDWVEPAVDSGQSTRDRSWEFRWTDGRDDGKTQGPFEETMMKAWQEAGYFGQGKVEFREVGGHEAGWTDRGFSDLIDLN